MPLPAKPSTHIDWTSDGSSSKVQQPSAAKMLLGWISGEKPSYLYMNWLFYIIDQWQQYFDAAISQLQGSQLYQATVDGVTYADLNAVMADPNIAQGARVFVSINLTVNTIQQITKNNIEVQFAPGIVWSNGTAGTGIRISATGVKLKGGRMTGFTQAVLVDSTSNYFSVNEFRFASNTTDIQDNNGKGAIYGIINE